MSKHDILYCVPVFISGYNISKDGTLKFYVFSTDSSPKKCY